MGIYPKICGYSIRALIYLSEQSKEYVGASELANATHIPKPILSQILYQLVKSGMLTAKRGRGGGFQTHFDPGDTSLWNVIEVMNLEEELPVCLFGMSLQDSVECCPTFPFWKSEREKIIKELKSSKLSDHCFYVASDKDRALLESTV